jgi:hypothetical protein
MILGSMDGGFFDFRAQTGLDKSTKAFEIPEMTQYSYDLVGRNWSKEPNKEGCHVRAGEVT